ncbi:MAG: glycosyl hydrolase 53 family protein [Pelomonas sp.]|nr:glycosyl hydrolase 53 family protein [Roseateles sp.]
MLERRTFVAAAAALLPLAARAADGAASAGGSTGAADAPGDWQDQGDTAASNTAALNRNPKLALRHEAAADYRVTSYRMLEGLAPGSYTLRAKARSSGGQPSVFAFARVAGHSLARTHPLASAEPRELVIPGIPVGADGRLALGLHSDARGGQWAELADIALQRDAVARPFLAGGDVSVLSWMDQAGARYADRQGRERDALQILKDAGHSIVRLRLYESPGSGHGVDDWYWPAHCMDLGDLLGLARRSATLGLQIELTFHYSDFWTNAKTQTPPHAWTRELDALPDESARFARLVELVGARTREVLAALKAQGTPPQFVSLGNEIEAGMLYPYGAATAANWPRLGALLKAGHAAVKAVLPDARVILHLDDAGNLAKYHGWFDAARAQGVDWDVIGASYYPFWTRRRVDDVVAFARDVTARYDRDLMIMEAGFNFAPTLPNGWPGQLADNGPYPPEKSSPAGQRDWIDELFNGLKAAGRVLGVLYWDPIMIDCPGVGWALHEGDAKPGANVVANTTLFDFKGRALPVLDVWRDHAPALPLTQTS